MSDLGKQEAQQAGEFLADQGLSQLFTSPLVRCILTAQIVAEIAHASYTILPELIELQPNEGEEAVRTRVNIAFEAACQAIYDGGAVGLVSHGGPIGVLLGTLGMESQVLVKWKAKFDTSNPLPPAGIWRAERQSPDHLWALELVYTPLLK